MSWISSHESKHVIIQELPIIGNNFEQFYDSIWSISQLPATTLELCRLRLAQLHNSEVDWQQQHQPIDQQKRDALAHWDSSTVFTPAEKACIEFTELYAMDVAAISDQQADAVKQHHDDAGLVALIEALGVFNGMTRLSLLWQVSDTDPLNSGSETHGE
ncbi:MAG: hypothetical protein V7711_18790 [Pseudomonadales bacterium]